MTDNITKEQRAMVLTEALPYIQKYYGKIIVIKYGGNAMTDPKLQNAVMGDIVLLSLVGIKVVLVHGGGPEISKTLKKVGKTTEFVNGLRVTDKETAEIVQMVLAGKVSKDLSKLIGSLGGKAMSLSGIDGKMIEAEPVSEELGYVGKIKKINPQPILDLLDNGYIPIISPLGFDQDDNVYNINADTAASRIAGILNAESMILMTNIAGIMRDQNDPESLIEEVHVSEAPVLIREGVISGGMIPKVNCCVEAIRRGVRRVFITDGRVPHSILSEILTNEGSGTMFL